MTIESSPDAKKDKDSATNLLTSLDHRANVAGWSPYTAGCALESYNSCFVTKRNKLGESFNYITGKNEDNGLYILTFDLGATKFQHAVLVVQSLINGDSYYEAYDETKYF